MHSSWWNGDLKPSVGCYRSKGKVLTHLRHVNRGHGSYEKLAEAFGGKGFFVQTPGELDAALAQAFTYAGPSVVNIDIDPFCGTESGSLQDHN